MTCWMSVVKSNDFAQGLMKDGLETLANCRTDQLAQNMMRQV